jgi:hypothetical protein
MESPQTTQTNVVMALASQQQFSNYENQQEADFNVARIATY